VDSDIGEETMGGNSEEEYPSGGRGTHNPRAPEYKIGARIVYLNQGRNEIRLGSVMAVHQDGYGGPHFIL
jgi:hypothetical protein